jgi:hypothetical protein
MAPEPFRARESHHGDPTKGAPHGSLEKDGDSSRPWRTGGQACEKIDLRFERDGVKVAFESGSIDPETVSLVYRPRNQATNVLLVDGKPVTYVGNKRTVFKSRRA